MPDGDNHAEYTSLNEIYETLNKAALKKNIKTKNKIRSLPNPDMHRSPSSTCKSYKQHFPSDSVPEKISQFYKV